VSLTDSSDTGVVAHESDGAGCAMLSGRDVPITAGEERTADRVAESAGKEALLTDSDGAKRIGDPGMVGALFRRGRLVASEPLTGALASCEEAVSLTGTSSTGVGARKGDGVGGELLCCCDTSILPGAEDRLGAAGRVALLTARGEGKPTDGLCMAAESLLDRLRPIVCKFAKCGLAVLGRLALSAL
jgi:hypothetical protein